MHRACFTPWFAVAFDVAPDVLDFEPPEPPVPPHPVAVMARAAAEVASNMEALFIVPLSGGYGLRGHF
jgi:hypothetical protein